MTHLKEKNRKYLKKLIQQIKKISTNKTLESNDLVSIEIHIILTSSEDERSWVWMHKPLIPAEAGGFP